MWAVCVLGGFLCIVIKRGLNGGIYVCSPKEKT